MDGAHRSSAERHFKRWGKWEKGKNIRESTADEDKKTQESLQRGWETGC